MGALATLRRWPARAAILLIEVYQTYLSPLWPPTCRFTPTCSQYAVEALSEYGVIRGSWLTAVRLAKCGPWHRGGWDPIPVRHNTVDRHDAGEDFWGTPGKQGGSRSRV
jgi:uncharacterized protein